MQTKRHSTECPSRHTPIADSQVCWDAHWSLERWAQCCSIALVAQLHPGRGAVQGGVKSTIRTPKWRFTPSSDADTLCHLDL